MHNNTRTQNQSAPVQNQGESAAINKLTDNEDEQADSCGCGSSHASDQSQSQNNVQGRRPENHEEGADESSAEPGEQNRLGSQMNEPTGDPENRSRMNKPALGNKEQNTKNQTRPGQTNDNEAEAGDGDLSVNQAKRPDVDKEDTLRFDKNNVPAK